MRKNLKLTTCVKPTQPVSVQEEIELVIVNKSDYSLLGLDFLFRSRRLLHFG